jgi:hypothetical protein
VPAPCFPLHPLSVQGTEAPLAGGFRASSGKIGGLADPQSCRPPIGKIGGQQGRPGAGGNAMLHATCGLCLVGRGSRLKNVAPRTGARGAAKMSGAHF